MSDPTQQTVDRLRQGLTEVIAEHRREKERADRLEKLVVRLLREDEADG